MAESQLNLSWSSQLGCLLLSSMKVSISWSEASSGAKQQMTLLSMLSVAVWRFLASAIRAAADKTTSAFEA